MHLSLEYEVGFVEKPSLEKVDELLNKFHFERVEASETCRKYMLDASKNALCGYFGSAAVVVRCQKTRRPDFSVLFKIPEVEAVAQVKAVRMPFPEGYERTAVVLEKNVVTEYDLEKVCRPQCFNAYRIALALLMNFNARGYSVLRYAPLEPQRLIEDWRQDVDGMMNQSNACQR